MLTTLCGRMTKKAREDDDGRVKTGSTWTIGFIFRDRDMDHRQHVMLLTLDFCSFKDGEALVEAVIDEDERPLFTDTLEHLRMREKLGSVFSAKVQRYLHGKADTTDHRSQALSGSSASSVSAPPPVVPYGSLTLEAGLAEVRLAMDLVELWATTTAVRDDDILPVFVHGFHVVYSVCCNRVLRDAAAACHRALCAALEEFVHSHVLVLEAKGLTLGPDMPQILALADAWATYRKWLRMIVAVFSYLNRYHVRHNNLPQLEEHGLSVARELVKTSYGALLQRWSSVAGAGAEGQPPPRVAQMVSEVLVPDEQARKQQRQQEEERLQQAIEQVAPPTVTLKSDVDSTEVVVAWEAARASVTLQQFMLATVEGRGQQRMRGLELRVNVDGKYLVKVAEFMQHDLVEPMRELEKPLPSSDMHEVVQHWYADFVNVEQETLFELILASNLMGVMRLVDLTCAAVASLIRGKTVEEIRRTFNLNNQDNNNNLGGGQGQQGNQAWAELEDDGDAADFDDFFDEDYGAENG